MIINELGRSPTRSNNVYSDNNEQASLAVFTAHAEHNLIKLKLYNNWSTQAVNNISVVSDNQGDQSHLFTLKISQSINVE